MNFFRFLSRMYQTTPLEYRVAGMRNVWGGVAPVRYMPEAQGPVVNLYGVMASRGYAHREITPQEFYKTG